MTQPPLGRTVKSSRDAAQGGELRRREPAWLRDSDQEAGTTMGLETIVFVVIIVLIVLFVLGYFGRGRRA